MRGEISGKRWRAQDSIVAGVAIDSTKEKFGRDLGCIVTLIQDEKIRSKNIPKKKEQRSRQNV